MSVTTPNSSRPGTLRIVPLGGLGHVGGNMMAFETDDDVVVVDCGLLFAGPNEPGVDYIIPKTDYLEQRRDRLRGYVITHGHEDHIGALPHVLRSLPAPVYGTAFTIAHLERKMSEYLDVEADLRTVADYEHIQFNSLSVLPIPVTHSVTGAVLLAIDTPVGRVIHTGDFRIDDSPIDGRPTDTALLRRLGDEGVTLLLSDSTNAMRPGSTASENEVRESFIKLFAARENRIAVTTFASNLHRVQAAIDASSHVGRTTIPVGRSMEQIVQIGVERGFLQIPRGSLAEVRNFDHLTRSQVTLLVSGSQGEARGSFARIADGTHGFVRLEPADTMILSAPRIPGNELQIGRAVDGLYRGGIEVIDERTTSERPIHTSGHAYQDEQRAMIRWLKPRYFVPIHGEYRHLVHHAETAKACGVASDRVFILENGEVLELSGHTGGCKARYGEPVTAGPSYVSGSSSELIDDVVLRDRQILSAHGVVFCTVTLDHQGRLVAGPEIGTRGVFHVDENPELIAQLVAQLEDVFEDAELSTDTEAWSEMIRKTLRRYFRRRYKLKPLLVPVVTKLE